MQPGPLQLRQIITLLGSDQALGRIPDSLLDFHELVCEGLPAEVVEHLLAGLEAASTSEAVLRVLGLSFHTLRQRKPDERRLSREQSERVWTVAQVLVAAAAVFGSREEAERWLTSPAVGINRRCPLDLLTTRVGAGIVVQHLGRLDARALT